MIDDICFITAYKQLVRKDLVFSSKYYIDGFLKLANNIKYNLVVYVENHILDQIKTVQHKFNSNIIFINIEDVEDAYIYKYRDIDTKILQSDEYKNMIPDYRKHLPEHNDLLYNLINHSKINFIKHAKTKFSDFQLYSWVDFGRFNDNINNIPANLNTDIISKSKITFQTPHGAWFTNERISPVEMLKSNTIFMLGASFIIPGISLVPVPNCFGHVRGKGT